MVFCTVSYMKYFYYGLLSKGFIYQEHLQKIPLFSRRCDLSNCQQSASNKIFKILHGCGHSFHLECFPSCHTVCPICNDEVIDAIKSLSAKASEAILNPEPACNDHIAETDNEDEEEEDDLAGSDNICHARFSIGDSCLQLRQQICSWDLIRGPEP